MANDVKGPGAELITDTELKGFVPKLPCRYLQSDP